MPDAHKNFSYGTIATAPSPATSGTSLVVGAGQGTRFPAPPFNATIWPVNAQPLPDNSEIVRVTNISTDTFTIVRTQESTNARSVVVSDQIAASITSKTLTDAESQGWLPFGHPKTFPNASADCDFDGSIGPYTAVSGSTGTVALLETSTSVAKYDTGSWPGNLLLQAGHGVEVQLRADYTLADGEGVTLAVFQPGILTSSGDNCQIGIILNDSDAGAKTGAYAALTSEQDTSAFDLQTHGGGGVTGGSTLSTRAVFGGQFTLLRFIRSGTNYLGFVSLSGGTWHNLTALAAGSALPNIWIYMVGPSAGQTYMPITTVSFIRVSGNGFMPW